MSEDGQVFASRAFAERHRRCPGAAVPTRLIQSFEPWSVAVLKHRVREPNIPSALVGRASLLLLMFAAAGLMVELPAVAGSPYGPTGLGSNLHRRFVKKRTVQRANSGLPTTRHAGVWIAGGYPGTSSPSRHATPVRNPVVYSSPTYPSHHSAPSPYVSYDSSPPHTAVVYGSYPVTQPTFGTPVVVHPSGTVYPSGLMTTPPQSPRMPMPRTLGSTVPHSSTTLP